MPHPNVKTLYQTALTMAETTAPSQGLTLLRTASFSVVSVELTLAPQGIMENVTTKARHIKLVRNGLMDVNMNVCVKMATQEDISVTIGKYSFFGCLSYFDDCQSKAYITISYFIIPTS